MTATPLSMPGFLAVSAVVAILLLAWAATAAAQDTVTIAAGSRGETRLTGRVVDYSGGGLRLELPTGREQTFPADQIVAIQTQYGQRQLDAEAAFAKRQFREALLLLDQARQAEAGSRDWVWRQITARIVECHRALDEPDRAGEEFLQLLRSDPQTVHFDCIPLAASPAVDRRGTNRPAMAGPPGAGGRAVGRELLAHRLVASHGLGEAS
jgi:hypothetical protein